jgi:hypothetical protein
MKYFVKTETHSTYVTKYANYLLRTNDWKQALLITQFMPVTERRARKHMTFQIIQQKGLNLIEGIQTNKDERQSA